MLFRCGVSSVNVLCQTHYISFEREFATRASESNAESWWSSNSLSVDCKLPVLILCIY
jgi:hypothetical protein